MQTVIMTLIILGAMLMVVNIWNYIQFMHSVRDVLLSGKKRDVFWKRLALVLLVFFLIGYLYIGFFSEADLMMALVLFFGSGFVTIVETLMFRLIDTARERSIDVTKVLVGVIDARDPYLNGHSQHVQALTMLLYRYLPRQMKKDLNPVSLEYAALLHDVGKLGVPEKILNKPAELDPQEWEVVVRHPSVGVKILEPLNSFNEIDDWLLYHHERIDGKGYYKLNGDRIPLASRMIAITDTYSAIRMRRSYKEPKNHEEAIEIMKAVSGKQLDPELMDIFTSIPKEEVDACYPEKVSY